MQTEEFNQIIENKIADIQKVLVKKAGEYAQGGDRLHNFKQAAHLQEVSLREALGGMMVKHTVSVYDMINSPETDYPQELWEEKIGDHLNYLLLLLAVVWEEKNAQADTAENASSDEVPGFATFKDFGDQFYGTDTPKIRVAWNEEKVDFKIAGRPYVYDQKEDI